MFSLNNPFYKHLTLGEGHFWPQGYTMNKLDRGLLSICDVIYQISKHMALWFQKGFFFMFSLYIRFKQHYKVPLCDAPYKISRIHALWFQERRFFYVFSKQTNIKHLTPGRVSFTLWRPYYKQTW